MSIFNSIKRLAFADNDLALLQSTIIPYTPFRFVRENTAVAVWDLDTFTLRFTCSGILIGVSEDGSTFLTHHLPHTNKPQRNEVKGWDAKTGQEIPLDDIDPDSYTFQQRTVVYLDKTAKNCPRMADVLTGKTSNPIQFVTTKGAPESVDSSAVSPNGRFLLATILGEAGGHDWMRGSGTTLLTGGGRIALGNRRVTFKANRFVTDALFEFSTEHNLLGMSDGNSSLAVYDLTQWQHLYSLYIPDFRYRVAFYPQRPLQMAVSTEKFSSERKKSFQIKIVEAKPPAANNRQGTVNVLSVLEEPNSVQRLLFHPDGVHLASLLGGKVHWWNVETQKREAVFQALP